MAVTVTSTTGSLVLASPDTNITPFAARGQATFSAPLVPIPPSLVAYQFHEDPAVRDLVMWANSLSERLQELLQE